LHKKKKKWSIVVEGRSWKLSGARRVFEKDRCLSHMEDDVHIVKCSERKIFE
jgi:hypothetical protein